MFPKISAAVTALEEKRRSKKIPLQEPPLNSENAGAIADLFRTNAEKCLGGN
jgi:hypothetical protein